MTVSPEYEGTFPSGGTWKHYDVSDPKMMSALASLDMGLDDMVLKALTSKSSRPRFTPINRGIIFNLRGVNTNKNGEAEDMVSLRIWSNGRDAITASRRHLMSVRELADQFEGDQPPQNPLHMIEFLLQRLAHRISDTAEKIVEDLEAREHTFLMDVASVAIEDISMLRRRIIMMTRYLEPQKLAIDTYLRHLREQSRQEDMSMRITETQDTLTMALEELEEAHQRAQLIKDESSHIVAEKMTRNTYILSIVAAIFLPLSFLTGLLGINVGGIPGADQSDAFWIFSGLLLVVIIIQLAVFKKKGWF